MAVICPYAPLNIRTYMHACMPFLSCLVTELTLHLHPHRCGPPAALWRDDKGRKSNGLAVKYSSCLVHRTLLTQRCYSWQYMHAHTCCAITVLYIIIIVLLTMSGWAQHKLRAGLLCYTRTGPGPSSSFLDKCWLSVNHCTNCNYVWWQWPLQRH